MKRFHVHVAVENLEAGIRFYRAQFGAEPVVTKENYAKWLLDEPALNFAISAGTDRPGVRHLGLQVDDDADLDHIAARLGAAGVLNSEETGANCCYARSNKVWATDPSGTPWENFHTLGEIDAFGTEPALPAGQADVCCGTKTTPQACCG